MLTAKAIALATGNDGGKVVPHFENFRDAIRHAIAATETFPGVNLEKESLCHVRHAALPDTTLHHSSRSGQPVAIQAIIIDAPGKGQSFRKEKTKKTAFTGSVEDVAKNEYGRFGLDEN